MYLIAPEIAALHLLNYYSQILIILLIFQLHDIQHVHTMQYVCENENEDVLRVLAFDNTVKDLILKVGASTSSVAKLRNEGFRMEIQELLEIGAINIENDHWLKDCLSKVDCVFLYFTAPLRLSEKGLEVFNRLSYQCYCLWKINNM